MPRPILDVDLSMWDDSDEGVYLIDEDTPIPTISGGSKTCPGCDQKFSEYPIVPVPDRPGIPHQSVCVQCYSVVYPDWLLEPDEVVLEYRKWRNPDGTAS